MNFLRTNKCVTVEGHDFSADPHDATHEALRDVARLGIGKLLNCFNEEALHERYVVPRQSMTANNHLAFTPRESLLPEVREHITSFLAGPGRITTSGFVRYRNGTEGHHTDQYGHNSGIRLLGQLDGPDGYVAVVDRNRHLVQNVVPGSVLAAEEAVFYVASYDKGALLLMPQSARYPLRVMTTDEQMIGIEHPEHFGVQPDEDGWRCLLGIDIQFDASVEDHPYVRGVSIHSSEVRTP